jgi:hypothetical protein
VFSDETIPGRVAGLPKCCFNVVNDTLDDEFTELLPPPARSDECTEFLFDRRVNGLIHVPSIIELAVKPCIPRLVERCKLTMFDERTNIEVMGELSEFLVIVSLVAG